VSGWVVDTCVLIDVGQDDPEFGEVSARMLTRRQSEGLVVCPVTIVELAPAVGGRRDALDTFLRHLGAGASEPWEDADTRAAFVAWQLYVSGRRARVGPERPIADILIGAFAVRHRGLITRNPRHFAPWFPSLRLLDPSRA